MQEDLLDRISWAARAVHKELGTGFAREVYLNALAAELQRLGLLFERDKKFAITYRQVPVGDFIADIVVENRLIVMVAEGFGISEADVAGMQAKLVQAGMKAGVLVDFGAPRLQLVRFDSPG